MCTFAQTTKKQLHVHMSGVPPQLPWHNPEYFSLNRKLLTVFPGIFRILDLLENPQLLFQTIMFFTTVPIVAPYECYEQDRDQILNYSRLIQNTVANTHTHTHTHSHTYTYIYKGKLSHILPSCAGVFKPETILKGRFLEFNGEYLAQAAKSVSLNYVTLASTEQGRRLYFNLLPRT